MKDHLINHFKLERTSFRQNSQHVNMIRENLTLMAPARGLEIMPHRSVHPQNLKIGTRNKPKVNHRKMGELNSKRPALLPLQIPSMELLKYLMELPCADEIGSRQTRSTQEKAAPRTSSPVQFPRLNYLVPLSVYLSKLN